MKRKFDETCGSSYTEARSLVLNISLGKLHSNSPKPVEPSLWRSLLIVKMMHRISEELKLEASGTDKTAMTDQGVEGVEEALKDQQLDTLFLLQNPPVAVLLSESESRAADGATTSDNCAMQSDDADDAQSSLTTLGTCMPLDSDIVSSQAPFQIGGNTVLHARGQSSSDDSATGFSSVRDDFDEIDCACLESFQGGDLSTIGTSLDRDFLFGSQTPLRFSAFSSAYENFPDFGSISELDCLMQVLEEECIFPLKF